MNSEEQKILLNQVRYRILQFILRRGNATAREIGSELSDIPQASLYRQIKTLSDSNFIVVSGERRIRGTLECTYSLAPELLSEKEDGRSVLNIQFLLLSIANEFDDYSDKEEQNNVLDFMSQPLFMSDDEYRKYVRAITDLTKAYIGRTPEDGKKYRRVTFVSSPA